MRHRPLIAATLTCAMLSLNWLGGDALAERGAAPTPGSTGAQDTGARHADMPVDPPASEDLQPPPWAPTLVRVPKADVARTLARADKLLANEPAAAVKEDQAHDARVLQALTLYLSVQKARPDSAAARAGVERSLRTLLEQGRAALAAGDLERGMRVLAVLRGVRPRAAETADYARRQQAAREAVALNVQAGALVAAGRLIDPPGDNAAERYRQALARQPESSMAQAGLAGVETLLLGRAVAAARDGDYAQADRLLAQAARVRPGSRPVQDAGARIVEIRQRRADALLAEAFSEVDAGRPEPAQALLDRLDAVSSSAQRLAELRERIEIARRYGRFRPQQDFTDPLQAGGDGPSMRVVPYGRFTMGSPNNEPDHRQAEGPRHVIVFERGFALSRGEISVGEFGRFVAASGYRTDAERGSGSIVYDERKGRLVHRPRVNWRMDHLGLPADPSLPVIHVSWNDAIAYTEWLSQQSGEIYRLPSEAQAEYIIRAGSTTAYPWAARAAGDGPAQVVGNLTGDGDRSQTGRRWANAFMDYDDGYWGPAPVRSFSPNAFGLFGAVGNVSEWMLDCWHDSYRRAPGDGSAWVNPGCAERVVRGTSWASAPDQARSAFRLSAPPGTRNPRVGFRVAREI